jgi:hypothetical protein
MAALVAAIHVLLVAVDKKDVDARHKAGHDGVRPGAMRCLIALCALRAVAQAKLCEMFLTAFSSYT